MNLKLNLKRLLGSAYLHSVGRARLSEAGVVLMLHRVLADEQAARRPHRAPLCVGQRQFEHLLRWLRRHFDCVPLNHLLQYPGGDRPRLALTFDDGWRDNAEVAYPLLERYEVPASIFLSTDFIGSAQGFWWESIGETLWLRPASAAARPLLEQLQALQLAPAAELLQPGDSDARSRLLGRYLQRLKTLPGPTLQALADSCPNEHGPHSLDWAQVQRLERSALVRFGPHGASHAILTGLDEAALKADLQRSHQALQNHCQAPLEFYCYPNGDHNAQVRAAVAGLGYRYALGTRPGLIEASGNPLLALPRIDVSHASAARPGLLAWRLLQGSPGMKRGGYLWHLALSMGTRLAMIGLRLLRNVLLARLLGPADRGLFALLSTLPDLIAALTSGGLNTAVGYEAARQRPMGLLLTQVLVYGCLLASLLTLAGLALMNTLGSQWELSLQLGDLAWLLLLAVPITVLKSGLLTLHNADGRVEAFNALRLLESLVPLLLFVGLWWIWRDQPLSAALVSWLGGTLLVVVVGWCWLRRFHDLGLRWQAGEQGKLLRYSAQSHPGVLSQQLMLRSDYLFIGALLDPAALGWYAMASAAAELLLIIPEAVTTPLMKRLLQQGAGIEQLTALALRLTATVMLGACLCMALIGQWLIVTLFGVDYAPAYGALLALLPGLFGLCYASILRLDLLGKQRPGTLSLLLAGGALLNLALNAQLIPSLGIVGAGLASSIAYLAVSLAMLGLYCHLSGVAWYRTLILLPGDIVYVRQLLRPKERLQ